MPFEANKTASLADTLNENMMEDVSLSQRWCKLIYHDKNNSNILDTHEPLTPTADTSCTGSIHVSLLSN